MQDVPQNRRSTCHVKLSSRNGALTCGQTDRRNGSMNAWNFQRRDFYRQVLLFWQLVSFGKMPLFSLKLGRDSLIDCEHTEYLLPSMNFSLQKKHLESKMYLKRPQMVQFTSISYFFVCKIIKKKSCTYFILHRCVRFTRLSYQ